MARRRMMDETTEAQILAWLLGDRVRWSRKARWFIWDGAEWARDPSGSRATWLASELLAGYYLGQATRDPALRQYWLRHALRAEGYRHIRAVLNRARQFLMSLPEEDS